MMSDEQRWQAVAARDGEADGVFVYAVVTTGVYCRPSCPSRRPARGNVRFFALNAEAEANGFRPCLRCRPTAISSRQRAALAVEAACRTLETARTAPTLVTLAGPAGYSPFHFQRLFRAHTGLSPRRYFDLVRGRRTEAVLRETKTVTEAAFTAGFASLSRFHDALARRHGMPPAALRSGGDGEVIVVAQARGALGVVTAAFSRTGVCALRLSDGAADGVGEVLALFPRALVLAGGADFDGLVGEVMAAIAEPALAAELPLDIRGNAFEARVWSALGAIPVGSTASYGEIARAIGAPGAQRAVARACAANPVAVLVPCHRVIRSDGSLAGYRWGVRRKAALLEAEAAAAGTAAGAREPADA